MDDITPIMKPDSEIVQLNETTAVHYSELPGRRIRLNKMNIKCYPVPAGATGKIVAVSFFPNRWNLLMNWDKPNNHRLLSVLVGVDDIELID